MSETVHDAIQRAQQHFRGAAREGLAAVEALFEAAILTGGLAGETSKQLREEMEAALADWNRALANDATFRIPEAVAAPLRAFLKSEIERWETRSEEDPSARPILRALLALRELLWEVGLQSSPSSSSSDAPRSSVPEREEEHASGRTAEAATSTAFESDAAADPMAWASIEDDPGWEESTSEARRGPFVQRTPAPLGRVPTAQPTPADGERDSVGAPRDQPRPAS